MYSIWSGAAVILLNMIAEYGTPLLEQAESLKMLSEGYAWLVTEGMTTYTVPGQFEGLIGTSPATGDSIFPSSLPTVRNTLFSPNYMNYL